MAAKHADLLGDHTWVVALVKASSKQAVPEEGHFLLQRAPGVDHAIYPAGLRSVELERLLDVQVVALQQRLVEIWSVLRVEQFLHGGLIPLGHGGLQFVAGGPKASTAKQ